MLLSTSKFNYIHSLTPTIPKLNFTKAHQYLLACSDPVRTQMLIEHGFDPKLSSEDAECISAILTYDKKRLQMGRRKGLDLLKSEVKLVAKYRSADYKFSRHCDDKFDELKTVNHIFVCYYNYDLEVIIVSGIVFSDLFDQWKLKYIRKKSLSNDLKNFEHHENLSKSFIREHGCLLMKIEDRKLVYTNDNYNDDSSNVYPLKTSYGLPFED